MFLKVIYFPTLSTCFMTSILLTEFMRLLTSILYNILYKCFLQMFYYFVFGLFATAIFPMIRFICVKVFFVFLTCISFRISTLLLLNMQHGGKTTRTLFSRDLTFTLRQLIVRSSHSCSVRLTIITLTTICLLTFAPQNFT